MYDTTNLRLYAPINLPTPPSQVLNASLYALDRIYVGRALWAEVDGYTPLNAQTLRSVTRNYKDGLQWLKDEGVIEGNNFYKPGVQSRGFRWTHEYHEPVRLAAPPDLVRKLRLRRANLLKSPVHRHLYHWLTQVQLSPETAEKIISSLDESEEKKQIYHATAGLIMDGVWDFTVCSYGRVHTPITRLVKPLRQALRINGDTLVNVDIANAQPLLLTLALRQPSHQPSLYAATTAQEYGIGAVYDANLGRLQRLPADVVKYIRLCESGQLYEFLMERVDPAEPDRDRIKEQFFTQMVYGEGRRPGKVSRLFEQKFPTVSSTIRAMKLEDYRHMAWSLQRAESRLMIHGVCQQLLERHPTVPIITVHDSIMTTPANAEIVKQAIETEFSKHGLFPTLRIEN